MNKRLAMKWRTFALPKRGHKVEEYEDAFAGDPASGRFAVADGASESSFAGQWASLLVEGFVHPAPQEEQGTHWREPLQKRWKAQVDARPLAWYAEEKRQLGAFATFLGLAIKPAEQDHSSGRWQALAVGDSCLFQISKDRLLASFPLSRAEDFGNQPDLLGSRPVPGKPSRQKVEWGKWRPGDVFLLMTDALAQWFLKRHHLGKKPPWHSLLRRLAEASATALLTEYIEKLRDRDGLRNDDVTLGVIEL